MTKSCWDVPKEAESLPVEMLEDWAIGQIRQSIQFANGEIGGSTINPDGARRKAAMMSRLDDAFKKRAGKDMQQQYAQDYRKLFERKLQDPGLLENFEYFDIPSSDYMIMFYLNTWMGKMADVMMYLHNYGWNLKGEFGPIPEMDVWLQMSRFEGMNVSERKKVMILYDEVDRVQNDFDWKRLNIFSFGGGNEPLRLYQPKPFNWHIFDDGVVRDADWMESQLVADDRDWTKCDFEYHHENLFAAVQYPELFGHMDFGYMFGVSMYLGPELLTKALMTAFELLIWRGRIMFDVLFWTDSMRRVIATQGWPKGKDEMYIFDSIDEALATVRDLTNKMNDILSKRGGFKIEAIQPILVEPWGVTSMVFILEKYLK